MENCVCLQYYSHQDMVVAFYPKYKITSDGYVLLAKYVPYPFIWHTYKVEG